MLRRIGRRWRIGGIAAGIIMLLSLLGAGAALPPQVRAQLPEAGARLVDRHGRLLYQLVDPAAGVTRPVPLARIAPVLQRATVAVEDASFWVNPGVDPAAIARAAYQNLRAGRVVAGGSTLTQQLVRLRYLSEAELGTPGLVRKAAEAALAVRLTAALGKRGVLAAYLNAAPYGNLAVGAEAAAWTYFGKPATDLSLAEAAFLAGLPQDPNGYDPFTHPEAAQARQRTVLDLMVRHGAISAGERAVALAEPLRLNPRPFPMQAPHFVEWVRAQLEPELGREALERGGLTVWTTLDLDLQRQAELAVHRHLAELADQQVTNAAVVILDPRTGEVLALVGSAEPGDTGSAGEINMALTPRQPGSALKPVTYAAALEAGRYTAATLLDDLPTVFRTRRGEPYAPQNYDRQFHGRVPLRVALASSLNVPAVQVLDSLGLEPVLDLGHAMGLTTLGDRDRLDLSLTLGGGEVRLLDLTAVYAAFADGGIARAPLAISRVTDAQGRTVRAWQPDAGHRAVSAETAWIISDILSDDDARALGFGRDGVLKLERPAAVKTGTTSDWRDNWTVGYTPDLTVGVWVGNSNYAPMHAVSGVTGAAPLWRDVLTAALAGRPISRFERPAGLVRAAFCADSDEPAGPACRAERTEWVTPAALALATPNAPGRRPADAPLRLSAPATDTTIVIDPAVPRSAQRLPVQAAVDPELAGRVAAVTLLVDGAPLAEVGNAPYIAGWTVQPGRHELWAVARTADMQSIESALVTVEVMGP